MEGKVVRECDRVAEGVSPRPRFSTSINRPRVVVTFGRCMCKRSMARMAESGRGTGKRVLARLMELRARAHRGDRRAVLPFRSLARTHASPQDASEFRLFAAR
jgi:hypothetical protein